MTQLTYKCTERVLTKSMPMQSNTLHRVIFYHKQRIERVINTCVYKN